MTLCRSVLKEDDILCLLYVDTRSDVSDNSDNDILYSDSDVPTTSSHKHLPSFAIVVTSDSETSAEEEESNVLESSDNKTSDMWCTADKKPSNEPFLGTTGLHIVIDNPESVVEVVSSVIDDALIQLLTERSNLYRSQNAQKWKVSPKTLKLSNITPEEMRKFLGLIILMGQIGKENIRDYWSSDPTISITIFPHTVCRNHFDSVGQAWHFNHNKHRIQGGYSIFCPCMNILYRNLGQFTAQNKNCHMMKL